MSLFMVIVTGCLDEQAPGNYYNVSSMNLRKNTPIILGRTMPVNPETENGILARNSSVPKLDRRFFGQKGVRRNPRNEVHNKIVEAPVPGMFNLAYVFQEVVHRLDYGPFPQQDAVAKAHGQFVLRVLLQLRDKLDSLLPEAFKKLPGHIALVREQLATHFPCEAFHDIRAAVVPISCGQAEGKDLPAVIDGKVKLKAVKPSCGTFPALCQPFEHLMLWNPVAVADIQCCGIHKADPCAFPPAGMCEQGKGHCRKRHQLHKAVIADKPWEELLPFADDKPRVVPLERAEAGMVEEGAYRHGLAE